MESGSELDLLLAASKSHKKCQSVQWMSFILVYLVCQCWCQNSETVVFAGTAEQSAVYVSVSDLSQRCYFIPHQAGLHEFHSSLN